MKDIYELDLHELTAINGNVAVLRVPGGWLYTLPNKEPVKVDFDPEFDLMDKVKIDPIEVIRVARNYYSLPSNFIKDKFKDGNAPLCKKIIVAIFKEYSQLSKENMAKLLNYTGSPSIRAAYMSFNNLIDTDENIKHQYVQILRSLRLKPR